MFQLDLKSRKPIYEQIVDKIKELIINGVLKPEDKIPSVRDLSKTLTINPNTIQKAYRELERQGFLYSISGLGNFISSPPDHLPDQKKINELKELIRTNTLELLYMGVTVKEMALFCHDVLASWEGGNQND